MRNFYYDLHVHSCLSPCADNDNTPNSLAGMASLCEINIVALTDHNTCKNCPAFFKAAARYGIIPVAGMELTTSEEIHVVCLFESLDDAMRFDSEIEKRIIKVKNRPDIFGEQLVCDEEDNALFEVDYLLSNATTLSIEDVPDLVDKYNGVCYPAHIDRDSNGIIAILGTLPETPHFTCVELRDVDKIEHFKSKYPIDDKIVLVSSDAHRLTDLRDKEAFIELPDTEGTEETVKNLIRKLRKV